MHNPRTKEDFDAWFLQSHGDPWGYHNDYVQTRLHRTLAFLKKKIVPGFKGTIIEFGAFDGSFTKILSPAFPDAKIVANDISEIAIDKLKTAVSGLNNITIIQSDMLAFPSEGLVAEQKDGIVVLLLECLYYMPWDEQIIFLKKIKVDFPGMQLFMSAPMTGGKYYTEATLKELFRITGYRILARQVLNYSKVPPVLLVFSLLMNYSCYFRNRYASQVLHYARPV